MAATISDLANGTGTTSTTTVVTGATVTGTIADKDWFVVIVAGDNAGGGGAASLTTVADSGGVNVYTNRALINYDPIGANVGATLGIYTCPLTANITNGTITATFSPATTAKAIQVYRVRPGTGEVVSFIAADATGSTGSATSHAAATISVSSGRIIFGAAAIETNTAVTGDADTTNGSWSTVVTRLANVSATDLSSMTCSSQYKAVTATGNQAWACTTAAARDSARSYVVLASEKILDATTPESYVLTGTDAATRRNLPMVADIGSYALTGIDAALTKGVINNYVISVGDDDLLLETGDRLLLETSDFLLLQEQVGGSYVQTGTDASLSKGQSLVAELGTYALTGTDATGVHRFVLDATTPASYALVGTDATTRRNLPMVADAGSYSLLGTDASGLLGRKIDATAPGSYSLVGTDATMVVMANKAIAADAGSYVLTGSDAVPVKTAPGAFSLVAESGSYSLAGTDPATLHSWRITAGDEQLDDLLLETGDFLLLESGDHLVLQETGIIGGVYALTGSDVAMAINVANKTISASAGSYVLTGTAISTFHGWRIAAGDIVETPLLDELGNPLLDELGNPLYAEDIVGGVYALTGTDVTLTKTTVNAYTITADPGSYLLTGSPVTLTSSAQPTVPIITRGEWPEKKRRRKEYERTAREKLRVALDRLFDGGEYDPPPEVFVEAIAAAEVVQLLPGLSLTDLQVVTDLIARIQELVRQRLLDEAQVEAATQIARQHLVDSIAIADEVYRRTRQNYLIKTLLLIAE